MLAAPTSKPGRDREEPSALLRVRAGPECPEGSLREIAWDSNPDCVIVILRSHHQKSPNLRHHQAHSQNKGLSRASWLQTRPSPHQRQAGEDSQSWQRAISSPERHPIPNCKQTSLLSKTSWDSRRSTTAGRIAARDQLPRIDAWHT